MTGGEELLAKFVSAAKGNDVKALISVGGVSGEVFVALQLIIKYLFEVDWISVLLFRFRQRSQQDGVRKDHH